MVKIKNYGNSLVIWGRDENYEKKSLNYNRFRPYFYVPDSKGEHVGYDGIRLRKVVVENPEDVRKIRNTFTKHYEADIPYTQRFMIDMGLRSGFRLENGNIVPCEPPEVRPRIVIMDIEVQSEGLPSVDNPVYPVSVITIWDSYSERYLTLHHNHVGKEKLDDDWFAIGLKDEREMLYTFSNVLTKLNPDILTGWYIVGDDYQHKGFDIPYMLGRMKLLGVSAPSFEGTNLIDAMPCFSKFVKGSSQRLKDVAEVAGYEFKYVREFEEVSDFETLLKYNWQDVDIIRYLEEKYKAIEFHWQLKLFVGVNRLDDTLSNMRLVDVLYLREAKSHGIVLPSKTSVEESADEFVKGAIVFQPIKGLHSNVAVFDFSRYYPTIILNLNLSPEGRGLFPRIIGKLLELRQGIENEMKDYIPGSEKYIIFKTKSEALKYITNSIYGVLLNKHFRIYNKQMGEKITETGRRGLIELKTLIEASGYKVVYGDTDSVMVKLISSSLEECLKEAESLREHIEDGINNWFKESLGGSGRFKLKFERLFSRVLFTEAKKKYAGRVVWEGGQFCDYILYKGFETVRRDQSLMTKKLQTDLLKLILCGADRKEIEEFMRKFVEDFKNADILSIGISKTITKKMDEYKTIPPHVRGAIYSNIHFGTDFKGGDSVLMVWVKRIDGYPATDVAVFTRDTVKRLPRIEIDWQRMIDVTVRSKVEDILESIGLSWEGIFHKPICLEDYMG
ncbi:MAG: DNA-directed DNA polymerase [Thermoproteota archaeon]